MTFILFVNIAIDALITTAFIYETQYYLHLKSQKINELIMNLVNDNQTMETIKSALIEHNQLCLELHNQNKITKTLCTYTIFNIIPTNLILLHQYSFENLKLYVQFIVLFIITFQSLAIFLFQYYFA